ncbi:hypothetical protein WS67_03600 [Burkholderia singularis]|uniref:Uncharacterized protein n=1 Tax=Burkholderia singularis TaxID=1503053 RepID=A0A103E7S5_9BURK|nr:hypothetical protein WS67_03600 [Burkholderia singularis]
MAFAGYPCGRIGQRAPGVRPACREALAPGSRKRAGAAQRVVSTEDAPLAIDEVRPLPTLIWMCR